ncbi:MAG: phosphohydrolase, partial [Pseudomonadota bacterium]
MKDAALYNSRIIKTFVEYLGAHYPGLVMKTILDYSGMTVYQLNDEGHWFNQNQVDRFYNIVLELTGNPNIALEVGRFSPFAKATGAIFNYVAGFITPGAAYSVIGKLYHQVSRACLLETHFLKKNQIEITVKTKPGIEEKPYQCENRKGYFEAISKMLTGKFAHIDHPVCLHQGGDRCQYLISWEQTRSSTWKRFCYFTMFAS